jgi:alpha-glucosidase
MKLCKTSVLLGLVVPSLGSVLARRQTSNNTSCPGYAASNVQQEGSKITADLKLAGTACNVYGEDLVDLKLDVTYDTGESIGSEGRRAKQDKMTDIMNRKPTSRQNL